MKKATIKRRKRVIPANQEDEDEDSDMKDAPSPQKTPERGTTNDDGSVNLGFRRRADPGVKHEPSHQAPKPPSPYGGPSTLAAYHQGSPASHRQVMGSLNDENRLPPLTSMASGGGGSGSDRQMSRSPGSFMSPSRKRSFSTTESESAVLSDGYETSKRISSIKDILNPSGGDDDSDLALPPLRSPGIPPTTTSSRGSQPPGPEVPDEAKLQRRTALEQETERIREMLAAKERELLAMGRE